MIELERLNGSERIYRFFESRLRRWSLIALSVILVLTLLGCSTAPVSDSPRAPSILMIPPRDLPEIPEGSLTQRQLVDIIINDAVMYNDLANQLELLQDWNRRTYGTSE